MDLFESLMRENEKISKKENQKLKESGGYKKVSINDPNKYICQCMDCGYETFMTPAEYDGCCPRCHEHHGFVMWDQDTEENIEIVDDLSESISEFKPYVYTGGKVEEELRDIIISVVVDDTVEFIDRGAFADCTALKTIDIPESVVSIGPSAFEGCSALESITLPKGLEEIRAYTFAECTSLKEITIPENVNWIAYGAFFGCSSLNYVKILSKGLEYIADDAFDFTADPMIDATEATADFDFADFCERHNLACEVEKE